MGTCTEIKLQELQNHTALQLVTYVEEVLPTLTTVEKNNLQLISKWGCDGSQQTQYNKKFESCPECDANIFQSSFVPYSGQQREDNLSKPYPIIKLLPTNKN